MQKRATSATTTEAPAGPVERIGRIAEVIGKSGAANEALGRLTPEVVDKLHEQRLFRLLLPRAYGGEEVDLGTWFRAMEALGKLDASTAWCIGLNATNSGGFKIADRFVPEGYSAFRERVLDSRIDSPLYKFPLNSFFATGFSGVALGIARSMLDAAVALAEKKPRAAKYALAE